jgi:hypothetical protein
LYAAVEDMKRYECSLRQWLGVVLVAFSGAALGDGVCEYVAPKYDSLQFQDSGFLPVYFSEYQLSLPERPVGFISTDGFTAVYPDKGYVSIDRLQEQEMTEPLRRMSSQISGLADYFRLIYGDAVPLIRWSHDELRLQRDVVGLDCHSAVTFFRVGDVDVILHEAKTEKDFHRVLVLSALHVELVTVKGSRKMALQVVSSIKRRL